ncbi:TraB/GumN family protein [Ohtaekwangia koreensis]|uniref:TraB family protein n=1 Tax=Ohtaekwangia koreensis TaxID=688867 RepID=A0A1T5MK08_9BACT|nr:TraB/GumN family protein [Ohtaekwangia koreensis]SKC88567.1 hypothetical protein SAMN05660236_5626 [Ohtaekwangia koreensis]
MIFINKDVRLKVVLLLLVVTINQSVAQKKAGVENSVFWEVSGNGLAQPSYLFGTFHLMSHRYADSLTQVSSRFAAAKTHVSEILLDSTMSGKMMTAAQLEGTTLDRLLTPEQFKQTNDWLQELSGYDLKMFNSINPMTIQVLLTALLQQRHYPLDPIKDIAMDLYFQQRAAKEGKQLIGLETFDDQIHAIFGQFTYERQAQLLVATVAEKDKALTELKSMNKLYREGRLTQLETLMADQVYTPKEAAVMLDNRNKKWMQQLPGIFRQQSTFVAVGALHLAGENGLVMLLRNAGYTVKPLLTK